MIQYEVWVWRQFESGRMRTNRYPVNNPFHAAQLIQEMSMQDLKTPLLVANAYGLEIWDSGVGQQYDGQWTEWESPFGESIDDFSDSLNIREAL